MIKKLQKRYIIISVISVFSVMTLIFMLINIIVHTNLNNQLDKIADEISENGGFLAKPDKKPMKPDKPNQGFINPETPFSTRYFTVYFNDNQEIIKITTESIYSVSDAEAIEFAKSIKLSKERGWINNFRYKVFSTSKGIAVVFVDASVNKTLLSQSMLITFFVLCLIGLILVTLIIILSKTVTKPIHTAYNKQKQFITDANHELKTPLTLIFANLDIAETELGENEWLNDIRYEGQKLNELVNKLVELSRMDEGEYYLEFKKFNLTDILKDIVSEFKYLTSNKNITITYDIEEEVEIFANEKQITKLIYILFDNASKYCDNNGEINCTLKVSKNIILSIENSYKDIEQTDLEKLFDRFYRSDSARQYAGGFGVGLSIAKEIVNQHKGNIKAYKCKNDKIGFKVELNKKLSK